MLGLTIFVRQYSEKIPAPIICDQSASQWAMLLQKDEGGPTPFSFDSLSMETDAVGVHDFALENLSTTLQALCNALDSFVPRVYPPQPNGYPS
jgi:hypothetical protein